MMVVLSDGAPAVYTPLWNDPSHPSWPGGQHYQDYCPNSSSEQYIEDPNYYGPSNRWEGGVSSERRRRYRFSETMHFADLARDNGIWVYSIGLGTRDVEEPGDPNNPIPAPSHFQDGRSSGSPRYSDRVKIPFLMRLANDRAGLNGLEFNSDYPIPPPDGLNWHEFPCVRTLDEISGDPQGKFFLAENTEELLGAFDSILALRTQMIPTQ